MYDHIVVGAGSAGCAVAARLSEDPRRTVLLVEAGGSPRNLNVLAPVAFSNQFNSKGDWAYVTEPEPSLDGRRIYEPRGKVLGGTSAMNAMLWVRGNPLDYDGWDIEGWGWDDVRPVFERIEHRHPPVPGVPGGDGPIHITRRDWTDPLTEAYVEAAAAAVNIPRDGDVSGPEETVSHSQRTIWKGRRWHTARAYLGVAAKRRNLTILPKTFVRQIVIRDGRALGIEWERRGRRGAAGARAEIVLSAGAFNTPHLLQLSGVGPAEHLRAIGIDLQVDNSAVGAHLTEHPQTLMNWTLRPGQVGLYGADHPRQLVRNLVRWIINGSGPLGSNTVEAVAHVRSQPELDGPDLQILFCPAASWWKSTGVLQKVTEPSACIIQSYWTPNSRGTVLARSSDPREKPAVRLGLLSQREDLEALMRGIRISRKIAATEPLASMLHVEVHPGEAVQSDAELESWIRQTCEHTFHPACTARIGEPGDGVVDSQLRVHGVHGLRIADVSVLPTITRANTNAPAIMIGERCAEMIRSAALTREDARRAHTGEVLS